MASTTNPNPTGAKQDAKEHCDTAPDALVLSVEEMDIKEQKHVVNSPRSLLACQIEGILP